jgi:cation diffusion facilitator CzcD-associated flavoprotein CzcO
VATEAAGTVAPSEDSTGEHLDVLIVGAGLSGIGAARHIQAAFPGRSYAILEARDAIGGTWDLFRYPGVRSDSDMHTLGYRFRPWIKDTSIADGPSILQYVRDTAAETGIDKQIRFGHKVTRASWSSDDARWTVEAVADGKPVTFTARFLYGCTGYYRYDHGYEPDFPGIEDFGGTVVHPQHWPEDLDYSGKRVVVIGSGATAITLVPAMTDKAAHVTMLQRSPTYITSLPQVDPVFAALGKLIGANRAYPVIRWKNVAVQTLFYQLSQRHPDFARSAAAGLPRGHPLQAALRPVGPAAVRRPGR